MGQATLSRDIHDLNLSKTASGYTLPQSEGAAGLALPPVHRLVREFVLDVRPAQNLLVVKTIVGSAQPVAAALDEQEWEEVVGTIAGDDAILIVCPGQGRGEESCGADRGDARLMSAKLKSAVLGASGYSGLELTRLLERHPRLEKPVLLRREGGSDGATDLAEVFPELSGNGGYPLRPLSWPELKRQGVQLLFLATPHEASRSLVPRGHRAGLARDRSEWSVEAEAGAASCHLLVSRCRCSHGRGTDGEGSLWPAGVKRRRHCCGCSWWRIRVATRPR